MRIDEMVRMQAGFGQKSKGKSIGKEIAEKTEFNVIEMLMGKAKGKKGKGKNKAEMPPITQTNPAYNLSLSGVRPPDWNKIYTKSEPAMTDEEFEKAISALAVEFAEKSIEIGNSGKSKSMINKEFYDLNREFEDKRLDLQREYVSAVSPNRKAAYAATDFTKSNSVYGNVPNYFGGNELMMWSPDGWVIVPTSAEMARMSKSGEIWVNTLREYETQYGQIPYSTISKSVAPNRNYL